MSILHLQSCLQAWIKPCIVFRILSSRREPELTKVSKGSVNHTFLFHASLSSCASTTLALPSLSPQNVTNPHCLYSCLFCPWGSHVSCLSVARSINHSLYGSTCPFIGWPLLTSHHTKSWLESPPFLDPDFPPVPLHLCEKLNSVCRPFASHFLVLLLCKLHKCRDFAHLLHHSPLSPWKLGGAPDGCSLNTCWITECISLNCHNSEWERRVFQSSR